MQYTTNFSLKKPQYADEADIEIINDNSDDIDNLIHQNRTMIAPAFDSMKAYVVGDPVVYLGELFVFIADKAAGAWDATKVEPTTAAEMGGGGTSALADLDDVEITNPSTGQALLFDDDDDVWKNQNLPDVSVTKEASGNPIEISDAASAPLVKCVTQITGHQAGTGTPSPDNIRPITAYTEGEIEVRGKNLFNPVNVLNAYIIESGGLYSIANLTVGKLIYAKCEPNQKYTVSKMSGTRFRIGYTKELPQAGVSVYGANDNHTGTSLTVTTGNDAKYVVAFVYNSNTDTVTAETMLASCMIEKGETATTYEPYTSTTHTTTYPSAIYQGNADFVGGSATKRWGVITFDGSNDEQWNFSVNAGSRSQNVAYIIVSDIAKSQTPIASLFEGLSNRPYDDLNPWQCASPISSGNETYVNFVVDKTLITSISDWRTWLSNNNLEFAYELDTPTAEQITPTNLPIKSLSGYNHIESSTGEMEVEYISGNYQALVDLIQSSSHVYSTAEQVVGKWTDGKDIYEKTFILETEITLSANQWNSITGVSLSGVETPIDTEIRGSRGTSAANVDFFDSPVSVWGTSGTEKVKSITFRYTKTSNRSLSAPLNSQKAQIEPLEEKGEEVPTEEEKAVEKPETEEPENER